MEVGIAGTAGLRSGDQFVAIRPKPLRRRRLHAQMIFTPFGPFGADATAMGDRCAHGPEAVPEWAVWSGSVALGSPALSCTPGTMYSLVLKRASAGGAARLMAGGVVETATGAAVARIGGFGLPTASGRFRNVDQGFIENCLSAGRGCRGSR